MEIDFSRYGRQQTGGSVLLYLGSGPLPARHDCATFSPPEAYSVFDAPNLVICTGTRHQLMLMFKEDG